MRVPGYFLTQRPLNYGYGNSEQLQLGGVLRCPVE